MISDQNKGDAGHDEMTSLVEEVMRGERILLIPPGGLLSCLFVPLLSVGASCLAFMLSAGFFPLLDTHSPESLYPLLVPMGVGVSLVLVGGIGFVQLIRGRLIWVHRLKVYVLLLLVVAAGLAVLTTLNLLSVPIGIVVTGVLALMLCFALVRSFSFLALASFFSAKRVYREKLAKQL